MVIVNSLWSSYAIWWRRFWSRLVQVLTCCLFCVKSVLFCVKPLPESLLTYCQFHPWELTAILNQNTVMSLFEAPGAKTLSRALLFHVILCAMGALVECYIWLLEQAQTSKTGCCGHCSDLEQRMLCLNNVFVYGFHKVCVRSAGCFYCMGSLLFCDN